MKNFDENFYADLQKEEEAIALQEEGNRILNHLKNVREQRDPNWYENNRVRSALTTKVY